MPSGSSRCGRVPRSSRSPSAGPASTSGRRTPETRPEGSRASSMASMATVEVRPLSLPEQVGGRIGAGRPPSAETAARTWALVRPRAWMPRGDAAFGRDGVGGQALHGDGSPPAGVAEHHEAGDDRRLSRTGSSGHHARADRRCPPASSPDPAAPPPGRRNASRARSGRPRRVPAAGSARADRWPAAPRCSIRSWVSRSRPCSRASNRAVGKERQEVGLPAGWRDGLPAGSGSCPRR